MDNDRKGGDAYQKMTPIKRHCHFLLDKEKGKPDAKLRYRIKWNKNIVSFNVGYRVIISKWSTETQRCINNTSHSKGKVSSSIINKAIQKYEQVCEDVFSEYENSDKIISENEFRDEFNRRIGKQKKSKMPGTSFFEVFDEFVKTMGFRNSWSKATYTKFNAIKLHIQAFDEDISMETLTEEKMLGFLHYQFTVPLKNTTISKNFGFFKWFLRWAKREGYYTGNLHETFRPKLKGTDGNSKEIIYLSWDELIYLYHFKLPATKQYLERVRDVFCFCCFTSLRYSDVEKLTRDDVKPTLISVVTKKTDDSLKIELNKYSKAILDKYSDIQLEKNKALPVISNSKMNEYLKELGEIAGLNESLRMVYYIGKKRFENVFPKYKLLTTHCGRRTFIVNSLFLGIPAEVVMKWTGHSDYDAMKPYIKIVDELKEQMMDLFNKKEVPDFEKRD